MSFRTFIYYCAAWGGAAALFGWVLGLLMEGEGRLTAESLKGMSLGLFLGLGLTVGGLIGGFLGQLLYGSTDMATLRLFGWTLTGLLIGAAPAGFDYLGAVMRNEERQGVWRKLRNGLIGGTVGGILGGIVNLLLRGLWGKIFYNPDALGLWSPSATGFVALGACIGLAVALAQIILREAWLKVEAGFRPGRQVLLTKPETTIGRAESCDIGLFGDATVEKVHAKITRQGGQWLLSDAGTASGTTLNGQRVTGPTPLHDGDRIQVGNCVLSFGVRAKEQPAAPPAVVAAPPA
jgi:hypothetical protein